MMSFYRLSCVQELPHLVMNIPKHMRSACQATSSFTCVGQELPVLFPGLPGAPCRPSPCHTLTYLADMKPNWGCLETFINPSVAGGARRAPALPQPSVHYLLSQKLSGEFPGLPREFLW